MDAVVEWVDVRERLPEMIGYPVATAVPGRYRAEPGEASGQDFWLVLPMYFTDRHVGGGQLRLLLQHRRLRLDETAE